MTSVKYYSKWIREAGRSHIAAVLSWGLSFLYMAMKIMELSLDAEYHFWGIGSKELCVLCAGLGMAFSWVEFCYLFQSKKQDFYYSLPVKKSTIFWSRYMHGLLQFFLPLLMSQAACSIYAAVRVQKFVVYAGAYLGKSTGISLLVFLVFYHIGILSIVISGKVAAAVLSAVMILAYSWILIENIFLGFAGEIYRHYYRILIFEEARKMLDPVRLVQELMGTELFEAQQVWEYVPDRTLVLFAVVWIMFLLALMTLARRNRKTELTGKAFTSALAERIIETSASLLAGLWLGELLLKMTTVKESGMAATGTLLCVSGIAGAGALHLLAERLVRPPGCSLLRRRWQMLAACACASLAAGIFLGNEPAFDGYLPEEAQLEGMAVCVNGIDVRQKQYAQHMEDGYETETRLLKYSLAEKESIDAGLCWIQEILDGGRADEVTSVTVCYYLKDKSRRYRTYPLGQEALDAFARVYETEEYKMKAYPLIEVDDIRKGQITWSDGASDTAVRLSPSEKEALLAAYKEDIAALQMTDLKTAFPLGCLEIISEVDDIYLSAVIYPSFGQTCEILKDAGIDTGKTLADYQIASIKVQTSSASPQGYTGGVLMHFYEEETEIAKWADRLIPEELAVQPLLCPADASVWAEAEIEDEDTGASALVECYGMQSQ